MIDESVFKAWQQEEITKLFYKLIKDAKEGMEKNILSYRTFQQEDVLKDYFWKGMVHAYETCLVINIDHLKEMEEEKKDEN